MESVIKVNKLIKQYRNSKEHAVDHISFEVKEGEFFSFLGPNGAGKTTTISILTTILSKTSGEVMIAGYDVDKEAKQARRCIGILFQNPSVDLELTFEENIRLHVSLYGIYGYRPLYRLMPREYKMRLQELAEMMDMSEALFKKLNTFSGGMRRKVEIVRSLMHQPKILFLDEPTQGLDAASRYSFWNYIQKVRKEKNITIFLTTHYLAEAEAADKVCLVHRGKIAMYGKPNEIKNRLMVEKSMYIDADDQNELKSELSNLGAEFSETTDGLKVVYRTKTPQRLIAQINSPLKKLQVMEPTLEEAYMNLMIRMDKESDTDVSSYKGI
ncbi:ATP-binding cassette domain-containing protein [Halalkalibacter sp. APA_J-10(15)]|uniref:ATP-binding cassette domain-containing protein n=1 Tax=unclassified Halalkalibacter TaxID=2893063 RepID=UPI001FF12CDC|nr:ABC transporter ATP-binding protein [Halalkalibacter sp. APA_J-10(15)]MCK0471659.1 ABC transporter ATP-binding protein [Halalkalibacter sp. APA_J-10(15)]